MTVRPGCLEGFKRQAAELVRITREKDTHTLRYDWFVSLDGTECEVREAYTGPEGLIEHNRNILEARAKLFKDYADNHFMTVYGEVSQQLLDLLKTHQVGHKWFSFVHGMEEKPWRRRRRRKLDRGGGGRGVSIEPQIADRLGSPALPRLLTLPEVAEFLAVSERTVRRLVAERQLPCVRVGCQLRFDRSDLLRWTSARKGDRWHAESPEGKPLGHVPPRLPLGGSDGSTG